MQGKKTYLAAVGLILFAVGGAITGAHDYGHAVELLIQAGALIALRLGVKSSEKAS